MESSFRAQILVDKLSKLNSSQQSIETLSHWCIFHMNKAKQVVETWEKQFHCAPREQRLPFLYLANDIIQNSRRKGAEFVAEFWKVLPDSLRDVIENGDDFGRNAALRLINIWEERKLFGSRSQILKEEFPKRVVNNDDQNWNHSGIKPQSLGGNTLDKVVSCYQTVYSCNSEDDVIFDKCRNAISHIEDIKNNIDQIKGIGDIDGGIRVELKGHQETLKDCIKQLVGVESNRANLVSLLREALQEQECKLDQVRDHLQAAQKQWEHVDNICTRIVVSNRAISVLGEHSVSVSPAAPLPITPDPMPAVGEESASVFCTRQPSFSENSGLIEDTKTTEHVASTTGVIYSSMKGSSTDFPWEKRAKVEVDEHPFYIPRTSEAQDGPSFNQKEVPRILSSPPPSSAPPPLMPRPSYKYVPTVVTTLSGYASVAGNCEVAHVSDVFQQHFNHAEVESFDGQPSLFTMENMNGP